MPGTDQGIDEKRYLVVPRTLIFLFDSDNRVLLLKGAKTKRRYAGLYNGIGGHIERGEDILAAAYRELLEETGITGVPLHFCGQITAEVSEQVGVMIFIFKGLYLEEKFINSSEGELHWIELCGLNTLPTAEDLPLLIPRVVAHQINSPVFIGNYHYTENGELETSFQ